MKYNLKKPCANCPFLREGGVRLRPNRITEIVKGVTTNPGAPFACHKTVDYNSDDPDNTGKQHCAGALILADKLGKIAQPQFTRIMLRFGAFDPDKLDDRDKVFDSVAEMKRAQLK